MKLTSLLILLLVCSCTTMHYQSNGSIPTFVGAIKGHKRHRIVRGEKEFYLWGLLPKKHIIYIDNEMNRKGFRQSSKIEVKEVQSLKNKFISIISFGLYIPKNYEVSSWGIVDE